MQNTTQDSASGSDTAARCASSSMGGGLFIGCTMCRKPAPEGEQLKHCARCKTTMYCSKECQTSDWPHHKLRCKTITSSRELAKKQFKEEGGCRKDFNKGTDQLTRWYANLQGDTRIKVMFEAWNHRAEKVAILVLTSKDMTESEAQTPNVIVLPQRFWDNKAASASLIGDTAQEGIRLMRSSRNFSAEECYVLLLAPKHPSTAALPSHMCTVQFDRNLIRGVEIVHALTSSSKNSRGKGEDIAASFSWQDAQVDEVTGNFHPLDEKRVYKHVPAPPPIECTPAVCNNLAFGIARLIGLPFRVRLTGLYGLQHSRLDGKEGVIIHFDQTMKMDSRFAQLVVRLDDGGRQVSLPADKFEFIRMSSSAEDEAAHTIRRM